MTVISHASSTLRSLPRPAAVPAERTTFIDRHQQLAETRALLADTRMLTVLGPGGVGKTRFAIRLVDAVRRLYADDAWFFDLSSIAAAGSAADEVATRLGLVNQSRDQEAEIVAFFAGRTGLLVLDSCEHVLDSVAPLVGRILDECPGVTVLATSRIALRLAAETVYTLDPLALPGESVPVDRSAVQLFLDRAGDDVSDPSDADLADVAEICRRLDGMPLAVELAATRARALSPRQLLDRLDEPLALLTRSDRDLPPRQRTLRATIAWSYQLCTEQERELWRTMSVFAGSWDLLSAEWMLPVPDGAESVLDGVAALFEKSIIHRVDVPGSVAVYSMLDTVREFGLASMSPGELGHARERHRDWYLHRLTLMEIDWYGPLQREWLAVGRRELPNIRAALEFSLERGAAVPAARLLVTAWQVVWRANGRFDELRRWGMRVLALGAPTETWLCQLNCVIAALEAAQGDTAAALARLDEAEVVAERLGDPLALSMVMGLRGFAVRDEREKIPLYERAIDLVGDPTRYSARGSAEVRLAVAHDALGHAAIAVGMRTAMVERAIQAGESYETSDLLSFFGINAIMRGDHESATSYFRQSVNLIAKLGDPLLLAVAEEGLANAAALGGDFERAATLLGSAVAIWNAMGSGADTFSLLIHRRAGVQERARAALGSRAFAAATGRGGGFTVEESTAYALGLPVAEPRDVRGRRATRPGSGLTAREQQVAVLVGQGLSDREIAERLVISQRTAEGHVSKSLAKLGLSSRVQLATWAARERGESGLG